MGEIKVLIKIEDTHVTDGETESHVRFTKGVMQLSDGTVQLRYRESAEGLENCAVTLTAESGRITMRRTGAFAAEMILEPGRRHTCEYRTPNGSFDLRTEASEIRTDLTETGGTLTFAYRLYTQGGLLSENRLKVSVKRKD